MERFTVLESAAVPLPRADIDTNQILPARFLQKPRKSRFGQYLFHDLRFRPDGSADPGFILNQPRLRDARIIAAGDNFACGSSRENAVWALFDYGIRAVVAPSFADIFFSNSLKNGLLPICLPRDVVDALLNDLAALPGRTMRIDLAAQTVMLPDTSVHTFEINGFLKHSLLNGLDELDDTLSLTGEIDDFERRHVGDAV